MQIRQILKLIESNDFEKVDKIIQTLSSDTLRRIVISLIKRDNINIFKKMFRSLEKDNLNLPQNKTLLIYGAEFDAKDIVTFLLERPNINIKETDEEGQTALTYAMIENNWETAELIVDQYDEEQKPKDICIQDFIENDLGIDLI